MYMYEYIRLNITSGLVHIFVQVHLLIPMYTDGNSIRNTWITALIYVSKNKTEQ